MQQIPICCIEESDTRLAQEIETTDIENSFSKYGQFSPIWVRAHPQKEGKFQVIFGNRRLVAAKKLAWDRIPAEIITASDTDALAIAFSENCDRMDFSDYEKALLLERLHIMTDKSYTEIGKLVHRSPAFVSLHIAMLTLFADLRITDTERNKIMRSLTEKHCRYLARIEDPEERWNTAKFVVKSNLGVRELEKICNRIGVKNRNTSQRSSNDQEQIRDIIFQRINGLSSRNIQDYYESICEKHFTSFSMFPDVEERSERTSNSDAKSDLRDSWQAKEYTIRVLRMLTSVKLNIQNLQIRTCGNLAYATLSLDQEFNVDRGRLKVKTRETLVFEKERTWKLIHEHTSTTNPFLARRIALSRREFATLVDR